MQLVAAGAVAAAGEPSTRHTLEGLTATISASNIMNVSRR
jgi:hypothetical protein